MCSVVLIQEAPPLVRKGHVEMGLFPIPVARERKDSTDKEVDNSRISSCEENKKEITLKPALPNPFLEAAAAAAYYNSSHNNQDGIGGVAMASRQRRRPTKMWISAFKERPRVPTDFETIDVLGEGVHSRVGYARRRLDGQVYAIKTLKTSITNEKEGKLLIREACAHAALVGCPNLARYFGCWLDDGVLSIQTELCSLGSLQQLVGTLPHGFKISSSSSSTRDVDKGNRDVSVDVSREDETQDADAMDDLDVEGADEGLKDEEEDVDVDVDVDEDEDEEGSNALDHGVGSQPCHHSFIYTTQSQGDESRTDEISHSSTPEAGDDVSMDTPKHSGIPEALAWLVLSTVSDTLSYMHARCMVHLDLRPSNLFIASTHPLNNFNENGKINKNIAPSALVEKLLQGEGLIKIGDLRTLCSRR